MYKEIKICGYELTDHDITHARLIRLQGESGQVILTVPMPMFAVTSFFLFMVKQQKFAVSTHKMFLNMMKNMGGKMQKIVIDDLQNGKFFATIYFTDNKGKEYSVNTEASDAIIMSLIAPCYAYALESIIEAAENDSINHVCWFNAEDEESLEAARNASDEDLASLPPDEFDQLLEVAAKIEDYEFAARLKRIEDEI
jgi:bifunctional DNase/RNase